MSWYSNAALWWPILILTSVWKGAGYRAIVYFCALTGFNQSLYEAAEIDGPTDDSVDQIMDMTNLNPLLLETTDTIATFVYRSAILNGQFESASAITLYQSIFGFLLVMGANGLVKKFDPDYALF